MLHDQGKSLPHQPSSIKAKVCQTAKATDVGNPKPYFLLLMSNPIKGSAGFIVPFPLLLCNCLLVVLIGLEGT